MTSGMLARCSLTSEAMMPINVSRRLSLLAQTPDQSAWPAIVPKTARFARCRCSFYRSALQVSPLLNSSLDPCPGVRLSAPADVAKHNYSTGPAGAKSALVLAQAHIGQSRTNGALLVAEGERKNRSPDSSVSLVRRHAHIDQDAARSMASNAAPRRAASLVTHGDARRSRHDAGFSSGPVKNSYSHGPFLLMRILLRPICRGVKSTWMTRQVKRAERGDRDRFWIAGNVRRTLPMSTICLIGDVDKAKWV